MSAIDQIIEIDVVSSLFPLFSCFPFVFSIFLIFLVFSLFSLFSLLLFPLLLLLFPFSFFFFPFIFGGMRRTRVNRDRAHHPCVVLEGGSGSGVRRYGSKGICGLEG